ncbi:MAG: ribonuclease III [Lachnospiraceae bacterium]|nr:ribonuclease III [Lachnospiraceae bacterium]
MEESINFDVRNCSPLTLAFVGDGIFDLVIRTRVVVNGGNRPVNRLHRDKAAIVNAHAQAVMAEQLRPFFTKEEETVFRRGRNAHSATTAKNQSIADYRAATGLEALCGYLYLTGQEDRLITLIEQGIDLAAQAEQQPADRKKTTRRKKGTGDTSDGKQG